MMRPLVRENGFTLIELIVVIVIIGLTTALTMPRFRYSLLSDPLKTSTRRLAGLINNLSQEAIHENEDVLLYFDLSGDLYWTEKSGMTAEGRLLAKEKAVKLPEEIEVIDIRKKGEDRAITGEVALRITKRGYLQPAVIHLGKEGGKVFTLSLRTFSGRVEIREGYVEPEG
jgi:type II secretion system protein H